MIKITQHDIVLGLFEQRMNNIHEHTELTFENTDFSRIKLHGIRIEYATFTNCCFRLKQENFMGAIFNECNFIDCDFSGITLENVKFYNCTFKNVNFSNCVLNDILFTESKFIDKIDFTDSKIDDTIFVGCVGTEAFVMNDDTGCFKLRCPESGSFIGHKCTDSILQDTLFLSGINATHDVLDNYDPLETGYARIFMTRQPTFLVDESIGLQSKFQKFKHIIEHVNTSIQGSNDIQMNFNQIQGGHVGKQFEIPSYESDDTNSIAIKVYEFSGSSKEGSHEIGIDEESEIDGASNDNEDED